MTDDKKPFKPPGRPVGTGTKPGKLLRVLLTPRQERLMTQLRVVNGISESEAARTALNDYFDKLEQRGELVDDVALQAMAALKAAGLAAGEKK